MNKILLITIALFFAFICTSNSDAGWLGNLSSKIKCERKKVDFSSYEAYRKTSGPVQTCLAHKTNHLKKQKGDFGEFYEAKEMLKASWEIHGLINDRCGHYLGAVGEAGTGKVSEDSNKDYRTYQECEKRNFNQNRSKIEAILDEL